MIIHQYINLFIMYYFRLQFKYFIHYIWLYCKNLNYKIIFHHYYFSLTNHLFRLYISFIINKIKFLKAFKIVYDHFYVNHYYYYYFNNDILLMVILLKIIKNNFIDKNFINFLNHLFNSINLIKNYLNLAINKNFSFIYFKNQKNYFKIQNNFFWDHFRFNFKMFN